MRNFITSACVLVAAIILSTVPVRATLTPYQLWQLTYFGSTNSPWAAATADPDSDSQNNLTEFIAGFDPTNSASLWVIQASPTNGWAPLTVSFNDNITVAAVTNRFWDFGDGGTSSGATPGHIYTNVGVFTVSETVFNLNEPDMPSTLTQTDLITVIPEPSTLLLVGFALLGATVIHRHRS